MEASALNIGNFIPQLVLLQVAVLLWIAVSSLFIRKSFSLKRVRMPISEYLTSSIASIIIIVSFTGIAYAYGFRTDKMQTDLALSKDENTINLSLSVSGTRQLVVDDNSKIIEIWSNADTSVSNYVFKITKNTVDGPDVKPTSYIIAEYNTIINNIDLSKAGKVWSFEDEYSNKIFNNLKLIYKDGALLEVNSVY